ncbi:MAG: hypothetical protein Q7S81_03715 [bacterium]|nr:hypothetical protein [bacterium]
MNEKIPKNIQDLLSGVVNDVESKNKQEAELQIEGLIESRAQEKDTTAKLEKIIKNYPEFKEKIRAELTETINKVGKKYDEAIAMDKLKNDKEERTVIENDGQKEILALRNEFLALKNIKKHFFREVPETNEDE